MASHHEMNDLLENIRTELPARAHDAYEEAVKRALRQQRKHRGGRGPGWMLLERNLLPQMWQRQQRHDENEGLLPILALVIGLIGGAALMYLFDPDRGARRRALLGAQIERVADEAVEKVEETSHHLHDEVVKVASEAADVSKDTTAQVSNASEGVKDASKQVKGAASAPKQRGVSAVDQALMTLVRGEVARNVGSPGAIEVTADKGTVTLTGQIPSHEVQALVEKVQALPGVKSLQNHLEIHDASENAPNSSGSNGAR